MIPSVAAIVVGVISFGSPSSAALSRNAGVSAEGVSSLSYAPKPFTDDLSRMRVRFTTTGRARPGHYYDVYVFINGPDDGDGCVNLGVSNGADTVRRMLGAPAQTYTVWLTGIKPSPTDFCHGKAELIVISRPINRTSKQVRILGTISFRVLQAP